MKAADRYLRNVRLAKARRFVRRGDVVVDIGCADGEMTAQLSERSMLRMEMKKLEKIVCTPSISIVLAGMTSRMVS